MAIEVPETSQKGHVIFLKWTGGGGGKDKDSLDSPHVSSVLSDGFDGSWTTNSPLISGDRQVCGCICLPNEMLKRAL